MEMSPRIPALVEKLTRDPNSKLFLQLAEEYRRSGLLEEAIAICEEGLERHAQYHAARVCLARAYIGTDRHADAAEQLDQVIEVAPDNLLARRLRAETCYHLGDYGQAEFRYQAILEESPQDREALEWLERIHAQTQLPDDVREELRREVLASETEEAEELPTAFTDGVDVEPPSLSGEPDAAWLAGDLAPAGELVEDDGSGEDELATRTLAELYEQQGALERAADVYRRLLALSPEDEDLRHQLERLSARLDGDRVEQEAAPAGAAGSEPEDARADALRSWLSAVKGESAD